MSVVVGIQSGGTVWVGADSLSSNESEGYERIDRKLFRNGEYVIGVIGSSRTAQILKFLKFPKFPDNLNFSEISENYRNSEKSEKVERFFVSEIVPLLQVTFERADHIINSDNSAETLIAVGPWMVVIEDDWQVGMYADGYTAIGSGAVAALGSLHSTEQIIGREPEKRLNLALNASKKYTLSVGGDSVIMRTEMQI